MSEKQPNYNKHVLLERLRHKPYFFDVQEKRNGLVVLVDRHYEKEYLTKVIKNKCSGQDVYIMLIQSITQYLDYCRNYVDSEVTDSFIQTKVKIRESLESKISKNGFLYPKVKIMEKGRPITTIDFVYKNGSELSLFKIAASKRKEIRKKISIKKGVQFFKRHFYSQLNVIKGYWISYENNTADYQLVTEQRLVHSTKKKIARR